MAGQGAKGGGQVAMPAAQAMDPYRRRPMQGAGSPSAMGGSRGPMGPQGALGGPSIVMPNGMSSGDVNMGGNVSVATGPIDTGLGGPPLGGQPPSAEMIAADMGAAGLNVNMADVRSSLNNILADRNMTPEERARGSNLRTLAPGGGSPGGDYMALGKPSPRVGPPPLPLYDTPGSASGIEIKGSGFADQDITHTFGKDDFYAFKSTLRDPGDMGRYIAPGEEMSYEDFVKFGRPANLAAATSAGYGVEAGGGLVPGSGVVGGLLQNVVKDPNPINYYMGRPTNMTTAAEIENFEAINNPNPMGEGAGALMVPDAIAGISDQPGAGEVSPPVSAGPDITPQPDMTQRPMPFSGLASLTKLPMFQEFATKLESEHPEASQLFSQMFMGSSQRPMPFQNPFMGMGMGSFHPMMGGMGMGMGGYNPMMGMGGGFNPMMGGMGMGGYSPFMGMNPMMGMGGGFNPMMGMSGGGLGSFYPQPSTYGPPQSMPSMGGYPTPPQSSPFGGAMRGYYA